MPSTWSLFAGAVATAAYARLAFRKQSEEVRILGQQLSDQQELTKQQAAAIGVQSSQLQVQSDQLELQRRQLVQQQAINEKQAEVADLQAQELRESIDQRKADAAAQRSAQARGVWIAEHTDTYGTKAATKFRVTVRVINGSNEPVYKTLVSWHLGTQGRGESAIGVVMPGIEATESASVPEGADPQYFGAVVFFHDVAGVCWRRRTDGGLDEIPPGQEPPHSW